jgi:hypothetical protein
MQTTNKELYHFWQEFSKLIKKDTPAICKKFNKKTFVQVLKEDFFETPRMKNGYPDFIDMANAINSKEIDFNQWVLAMIGEFIAGKLKKKNCLNPNYMKNVVKFYTVKEINHQRDLINKLSEDADSDCPFTEFSDAKFDLYQVNEQQKNKLYEMVRKGELNYWFFLEAEDNNCFKIDESKIIDQSFNQFLRLMHIIRQNIKE